MRSFRHILETGLNRQAVHLLLILVAVLAVYSNTFNVPFQFDDEEFIEKNPVIRNLDNFFSNKKGYDYNPRRVVCFFTFAVNYRLHGLEVTGYHALNLAVHLCASLLVYFLVLFCLIGPARAPAEGATARDRTGPSRMIPLFAALLFACHPVQTQAVTYISQRMTSLAALFYLLSVVAYCHARSAPRPSPGAFRFKSAALYLVSLLSAVLAMKTKEIAFTLPAVLVLVEFLFFPAASRKMLLLVLPVMLVLALASLGMMDPHKTMGALLSDLSEKTRLQTDMPRWDYLMTELRVIVTYIRLLFVPINQNLDYDFPLSRSFFEPAVLLSFLFLSAIAGLGAFFAMRARRKEAEAARNRVPAAYYRLAAFGIFWFFITLAVESSVIPIVDVIFEHRLYLPSVGALTAIAASVFIIAAALRGRLPGAENGAVLAAGLAVLALMTAGFARNIVWQDQVRLNQDIAGKSPRKARAHANLAVAYGNAGMFARALSEFKTALILNPGDASVHNNLGIAYHDAGLLDEAVGSYQTAIRLRPAFAEAHYNLGVTYAKKGQPAKAIDEYRAALALQPDQAAVHNNLGSSYGALGRIDEAAGEFQTAIALSPDYREAHYNLGLIYQSRGLAKEAEEQFRIAEGLQRAGR